MRISDWSSDVCSSDLTWAQIKSDWFRGWRPAGRFIGGTVSGWFPDDDRIKPPPWVPALLESLSGSLREQEPLFAKAYLQQGEDSAGTDVYQLAAAFYQAKRRLPDGRAADYPHLQPALDKIGRDPCRDRACQLG